MSHKENKNLEKATFILRIIALGFVLLMFLVSISVIVTKFILAMNEKVKISKTREAKMKARKDKERKSRIRHILKQRKLAREDKKNHKDIDAHSDLIDPKDNEDEDLEDFIQDLDNLLLEDEHLDNEI